MAEEGEENLLSRASGNNKETWKLNDGPAIDKQLTNGQ